MKRQARNQNFGQVSNAFVRIVNEASGEEVIRFDLGEDFSIETGVVVGELYRHSGEWKFWPSAVAIKTVLPALHATTV